MTVVREDIQPTGHQPLACNDYNAGTSWYHIRDGNTSTYMEFYSEAEGSISCAFTVQWAQNIRLKAVKIIVTGMGAASDSYIQAITNAPNGNLTNTFLWSGKWYPSNGYPGCETLELTTPVVTNGFGVWIKFKGSVRPRIYEVVAISEPAWHLHTTTITYPSTSAGTCTTFGQHSIEIHNVTSETLQFQAVSNNTNFVPASGWKTCNAASTTSIPVQFCPTSAGDKSGTITISCRTIVGSSCGPTTSTTTVNVSGTATAASNPWLMLDTNHNFGDVTVNTYSPWKDTGVKNNSATTLNYTVSSNSSYFTLDVSSFSAPAGGWGYFAVRFRPTSVQSYSGTITVTCTTTGGSPSSATLSVSGAGVVDTIYPKIECQNCVPIYDFGERIVGETSQIRYISIKNIQTGGPAADTVFGCSLSSETGDADQFEIALCQTFINPGESQSYQVRFKPTSAGVKTAIVKINCNNCTPPGEDLDYVEQIVTGTGKILELYPEATIAGMTVSPTTVTHPGPEGAEITVTASVKNTGDIVGLFFVELQAEYGWHTSEEFTLQIGEIKTVSHTFKPIWGTATGLATFHTLAFVDIEGEWVQGDYQFRTAQINHTKANADLSTTIGNPGPFQIGDTVVLAIPGIINIGSSEGTVYTRYYYKKDGIWVSPTNWLKTDTMTGGNNTVINPTHSLTLPDDIPTGQISVGLLVWGEDETEPTSEYLDIASGKNHVWTITVATQEDDWFFKFAIEGFPPATDIDYGNVPVGNQSYRGLMIENNTQETLEFNVSLSDMVNFDDFSDVTQGTISVPPGDYNYLLFDLGFIPQTTGVHQATLTVTCLNGTPTSKSITLTGNGTNPNGSAAFREPFVSPGETIHADFTWIDAFKPYGGGGAFAYMDILKPDGSAAVLYDDVDNATGEYTLEHVCVEEGTYTAKIKVRYGDEYLTFLAYIECTSSDIAIGYLDDSTSVFYNRFVQGQKNVLLASPAIQNVGFADGVIYTRYYYKKDDVWNPLTMAYSETIPAGETLVQDHYADLPLDLTVGSYSLGVKIWSEDEIEPVSLTLVW